MRSNWSLTLMFIAFYNFWKISFGIRRYPLEKQSINENVEIFLNESMKLIAALSDEIAKSNAALDQISRACRQADRVNGIEEKEIEELESQVGLGMALCPETAAFVGEKELENENEECPNLFGGIMEKLNLKRQRKTNPNRKPKRRGNNPKSLGLIHRSLGNNQMLELGKISTPTCNPLDPFCKNLTRTLNPAHMHDPFFYFPLGMNVTNDHKFAERFGKEVTCKMVCCPIDGGKNCFEVVPDPGSVEKIARGYFAGDIPCSVPPPLREYGIDLTNPCLSRCETQPPSVTDVLTQTQQPETNTIPMSPVIVPANLTESTTSPRPFNFVKYTTRHTSGERTPELVLQLLDSSSRFPITKKERFQKLSKFFKHTVKPTHMNTFPPRVPSYSPRIPGITLNVLREGNSIILEYDLKDAKKSDTTNGGVFPPNVSRIDTIMKVLHNSQLPVSSTIQAPFSRTK